MKSVMLAVFVLIASFTLAQMPHPYVYGGGQINGSGYSTFSYVGGVGVQINTEHFSWHAEGDYDNAAKTNDNTINNFKGRDRGLRTTGYFRLSNGWLFGPGVRWSGLSTTNYQKQTWHGTLGVGKDFMRDTYSFRLTADALVPGVGSEHVSPAGCTVPKGQCTSGAQGVDIHYFIPSPMAHGHFFFMLNAGIYVVHTTVTSADPVLTAIQKGSHTPTGSTSMTLLMRW